MTSSQQYSIEPAYLSDEEDITTAIVALVDPENTHEIRKIKSQLAYIISSNITSDMDITDYISTKYHSNRRNIFGTCPCQELYFT
jgi:hypothetical protein